MFSKKLKLHSTFDLKRKLTAVKFYFKDYNPAYFVRGLKATPGDDFNQNVTPKNFKECN